MAYRLPTFNLAADIYRILGLGGTYGVPDLSQVCNLCPGKRDQVYLTGAPATNAAFTNDVSREFRYALFPALTDVRATWNGLAADIVEIPSGSQRFYVVIDVEDVGKGFPNEHRMATLLYMRSGSGAVAGGLGTTAPVPLP